MSEELIVSCNTEDVKENAEEKGRELYQNNKNYQRLATIMEHPEFRNFYDIYMKDPLSLQTMIMFMKVYESVEKNCNPDLTPYQKLAVVHEIFNRSNLRRKVVEGIMSWRRLDDDHRRRLDDDHRRRLDVPRLVLNNKNRNYTELNTDSKYLLEH